MLVLLLSLLVLPIHGLTFKQCATFASDTFSNTVAPVGLIPNFFKWLFKAKPAQRRKESLSDRINAVTKLQLSPSRFVAYQGQSLKFNEVV